MSIDVSIFIFSINSNMFTILIKNAFDFKQQKANNGLSVEGSIFPSSFTSFFTSHHLTISEIKRSKHSRIHTLPAILFHCAKWILENLPKLFLPHLIDQPFLVSLHSMPFPHPLNHCVSSKLK